MATPPPFEIVIAGGGTAGWVAAATLARFVGNAASITLVESDEIGTVGVGEATIPQIHNLIVGLGLDQAEFVRRTNATFKLGIEFSGWNGSGGDPYIHSFGHTGRAVGLIPFRQLWLRGRSLGVAAHYGDYAFNIAAARLGRMARSDGKAAIPDLSYAYHFDASLFAAMLRDYSEQRGVVRVEGRIVDVERSANGDLATLTLDGERRIAGTLFIDCTGFRSLLLGQALGVSYLDWSRWLPCDSALAVPSEAGPELRPYTQAMARPAGWQWRIPLQHRTGNGHVYCSAVMSDDKAADLILANLEGKPLADPRPIRFTSGRRAEFWSHNCLALGLAAGFMEPLESTSIHLVQSAVSRLLGLLPGDLRRMSQARETFNRLSEVEWTRVRDFIVLHYVANQRAGDPFWDECRTMELPPSLTEKIALFREAGLFVREQDELFLDDSWGQVMIGQGIIPESWSPLADNVPGEDIGPFLASLATSHRVKAESLPTHKQFVEAMVGGNLEHSR